MSVSQRTFIGIPNSIVGEKGQKLLGGEVIFRMSVTGLGKFIVFLGMGLEY